MSDTEQNDRHGIFTGDIRKNAELGPFVIKVIQAFFDHIDIENRTPEDFLKIITDDSQETLEFNFKKSRKREKKKKEKFSPSKDVLKRPLSGYHMFRKEEFAKLEGDDRKNGNTLISTKWNELNAKGKAKYNKRAAKAKQEYQTKYDQLLKEAIENGDFPEPKPKQPISSYFSFIHNESIKEKVIQDNKLDTNISLIELNPYLTTYWKECSDNIKEPFITTYKKSKEEYKVSIQAWEDRAKERQQRKEAIEA
tara:strand:+ start:3011 stop:3766 length:756 start_codon:yes stop_codon:yes gene_type:complete